MMKIKYVVVKIAPAMLEMPVLLAEGVPHALAAKIGEPVSAGFCNLAPHGVHAWGESLGLKLISRGDRDANLIAQFFQGKPPVFTPG